MGEPNVEIDVLFVGQTGVGKSSLINMIRRIKDTSETAAKVSSGVRPCTEHTASYRTELGTGLRCLLWDTRGLDEAVDNTEQRFMVKLMERIRHLAFRQERELKDTIRDRTRLARPILVWCIHATKIKVSFHWEQFQKVYEEYCDRNAIPVVVITRMASNLTGWETTCRNQLQSLGLGDVPLLRVREHRNSSSAEWTEDSEALRDIIFELMEQAS